MESEKIAEVRYFPLDALPHELAPFTVKYIDDLLKR